MYFSDQSAKKLQGFPLKTDYKTRSGCFSSVAQCSQVPQLTCDFGERRGIERLRSIVAFSLKVKMVDISSQEGRGT